MPPEERALLKAIIADPDDDTRRLAYADWLDENADSLHAARRKTARVKAQLIRVQIEQAALIFGTLDFVARYEALGKRERDLLEQNLPGSGGHATYDSLVAELEGVTPARGLQFFYRRGLFGKVDCTVKYFVEHGAVLFDAAPITAVRLKQFAAANMPKLLKCPYLSRVRTLKFAADSTPLELLAGFLHVAPLGHLRGLSFKCNVIDGTSDDWHGRANSLANRIAIEPQFAGLKRLSFYAAGVSQSAGRALANAGHLEGLEVLDLRQNPGLGNAKGTLRKRFGKRFWFDHDDLTGLPLGILDW